MKIKLKGAQTGHSLLKRKSDALSIRFRSILGNIRTAKFEMAELTRGAALALAQVNYAAGDISFGVRESVTGPAQFQIRTRIENVSGVQLPIFEIFMNNSTSSTAKASSGSGSGSGSSAGNPSDFTAISRGGQQVQKCRETNLKVLQSLLSLASLQTAFHILDQVIHTTNRRVNALEYVILPKTENTINYITSELDEQDREEFFRLKKIQSKKKLIQQQAEQLELERQLQELSLTPSTSSSTSRVNIKIVPPREASNLLELENDPDIIF